jgi:hypothetical protein
MVEDWPVKKLIVSAALLLGTVTSHQAAACDMGAIETWVVSVCQRSNCATKSTTKNSAKAATKAIASNFSPMCDPDSTDLQSLTMAVQACDFNAA